MCRYQNWSTNPSEFPWQLDTFLWSVIIVVLLWHQAWTLIAMVTSQTYFYFILLILCSWGVSFLVICEEAENSVSCMREKLLGATQNGLSQFKEYFTSRSIHSILIILGSQASWLIWMEAAPLRAAKSPESQLGTRAKTCFPAWLWISRGEKFPLPLIYGLIHCSNSERWCTGKGRDDREDQQKIRKYEN